MSEENVEVVRRANAAFNNGDDEVLVEVYAPDAELRDLANAPDQAGVVKGRDAIQRTRDLWTAAFDEFRADITEYTDVGDVVICAVRWYGRGKGSGMSIDVNQFDLYVLQEGRIVSATLGFASKDEALEAAGLSGQAMSEENVEVVRKAYENFNRGEPDGMVADFAPTFEYAATGVIPGSTGVYRGPEGYKAFLGWFWDEFQDACVELHGLIDAGDQVLAELTLRGRGKKSGAEARWNIWQLWTLRDGKAVHAQGFTERAEALEAAGLSEQAMSEENVEIVRGAIDAFNRGNYEAALAVLDEDVEWHVPDVAALDAPASGAFAGGNGCPRCSAAGSARGTRSPLRRRRSSSARSVGTQL